VTARPDLGRLLVYVVQRVFWTGFLVVGITLLTFGMTNVIPADPARAAAGLEAREEQVQEMRRRMGLDRPLHVQYFGYMSSLARGDWGIAGRSQRPVLDEIKDHLPATLELVAASMVLAVCLGIPMGILAAVLHGSLLDRVLQTLAIAGTALPAFWLALLLQVAFFLYLRLLPAGGRYTIIGTPPESVSGLYVVDALLAGNLAALKISLLHLVLPAVTLSLGLLANLTRITRKSVLNVLARDFVRTARAKGLGGRAVILQHVLKNAAIPIITITGLQTGYLFSSSVLVEVVFSWPGLGLYAVEAIGFLDFKAIMGATLVIAFIFVLINLVVDLSYALIDPRIRY
jgi:peptide/nickel transport system permease protein